MIKVTKSIQKIVDQTLEVSTKGGKFNEKNIADSIKEFKKLSTSDALEALTLFLKGLKRFENDHTLTIESAENLTTQEITQVKKSMDTKYQILNTKFQLNPSLLGGLKIKIGDVIFDNSVKAKLEQIKEGIIK